MPICPICLEEYKQLTVQHIRIHGLNIDNFRKMFPTISLGNPEAAVIKRQLFEQRKIVDNIRCKQCDALILSHDRRNRQFCSRSCAASYNNKYKSVKKLCVYCKREFTAKNAKAKYCSLLCFGAHHKAQRVKVICSFCKKDVIIKSKSVLKNKDHFCSVKCSNLFYKGTKLRGAFSINGKKVNAPTSISRRIAFENLEHKCFYCNYNKCFSLLQVHHIDGDRSNNNLDNLKIVCPTCHGELHVGLIT